MSSLPNDNGSVSKETDTNSKEQLLLETENELLKKEVSVLERKLSYLNYLSEKIALGIEKQENDCHMVRIKVGNQVFHCYRLILALNSEYFAALFRHEFKEANENEIKSLPTEHVSELAFSKLLRAMYGKRFELRSDDVLPIFSASTYLHLTYIVNQCKEYIRMNIRIIDAFELIMQPQLKFDKSLYTFVKEFVCRNFAELHPRMIGVSLEIFEDIFSDPELFISSKEQVLNFGRCWISYDLQQRKQHLRKVSSILKPFHTPSDRSLELVSIMEHHVKSDYNVKIALNTLLDLSDDTNDLPTAEYNRFCGQDSLFFVRADDNAEIQILAFSNESWVFDELSLPVTAELSTVYEGAVTNGCFYFAAVTNDVIFRGFKVNDCEQSWVELLSPRKMPKCLTVCNSTVYSYEDSFDDYQITFFEPVFNRWLKVPSVKYSRKDAGIASNGSVLYMIGGIRAKEIASQKDIIQMYDSRCGRWSYIIESNNPSKISNASYTKRVCCLDNFLYVFFPSGNLSGFDIRNHTWTYSSDNSSLANVSGYSDVVDKKLWFICKNPTDMPIRAFNSNCQFSSEIPVSHSVMKPIYLPYKM